MVCKPRQPYCIESSIFSQSRAVYYYMWSRSCTNLTNIKIHRLRNIDLVLQSCSCELIEHQKTPGRWWHFITLLLERTQLQSQLLRMMPGLHRLADRDRSQEAKLMEVAHPLSLRFHSSFSERIVQTTANRLLPGQVDLHAWDQQLEAPPSSCPIT